MTAAIMQNHEHQIATIPQEKEYMPNIAPFQIRFSSMAELMEFSRMAANSSLVPTCYKGKPADIVLCIQMGAELGLSAMQSLQSIAVINGKPCVYGDGALGLVQTHPDYEYHKEWYSGSLEADDWAAHCLVKRKGNPEYTKTFSMKDAKQANLWKKNQVWTQYPDRMLQMRARAFCIRDQFADALKGLSVREEVEDYNVKVTESIVNQKAIDAEVFPTPHREELMAEIVNASSLDGLKKSFDKAKLLHVGNASNMQDMIIAKDKRKSELEVRIEEFKQELADAEALNPNTRGDATS